MKQTKHIRAQSSLINKKPENLDRKITKQDIDKDLKETLDSDDTQCDITYLKNKLDKLEKQHDALKKRVDNERLEKKKDEILTKNTKSIDDNLKYYISFLVNQELETVEGRIKSYIDEKIINLQENIVSSIEENNTINKLDLQHIRNQIKRNENNFEEILCMVESNSFNQIQKKESSQSLNNRNQGNIYASIPIEPIINLNINKNSSNFIEDFKLEKIEDILKKCTKTEKVIEEVLKQFISLKKNIFTNTEDIFKLNELVKTEIAKVKEKVNNQNMMFVNDIDRIKEKIFTLKDESKTTTNLFEKVRQIEYILSVSSFDYGQVKFGIADCLKSIEKTQTELRNNEIKFNEHVQLFESK